MGITLIIRDGIVDLVHLDPLAFDFKSNNSIDNTIENGLAYNEIGVKNETPEQILITVPFISEVLVINNIKIIIINLFSDCIQGTVLGNDRLIRKGDLFRRLFTELTIYVGFHLIGRIINPVCFFLD